MVAPVLESSAREGAADAISVGRSRPAHVKVAVGVVLGLLLAGYATARLAMPQEPQAPIQEPPERAPVAASAPVTAAEPPEAPASPASVEVLAAPSEVAPLPAAPSASIPKPIRGAAPVKPAPRSPAPPPPSRNSDDPFAKRY
jgi:hypothetical protein